MKALLGDNYHTLIPITIFRYNNFLKQPHKKEMFVNELEKPTWENVKAMPLTSDPGSAGALATPTRDKKPKKPKAQSSGLTPTEKSRLKVLRDKAGRK